jgi:hypothetical protein
MNDIPKESGSIRIIESPWTGWGEDQPEIRTITVEPKEGDEVILKGVGEKEYVLTVADASFNKVRLEVDGLALTQGEDVDKEGVDLTGCGPQNFELKIGEMIKLSTCTTDMGVKWTVTYLK